MPKRTAYIRNADLALWEACEWKSELIHRALHYPPLMGDNVFAAENQPSIEEPPKPEVKPLEFCKHGQVMGFCKKGCK